MPICAEWSCVLCSIPHVVCQVVVWHEYLISHHLSDPTKMSTSKTKKIRKGRQDCEYTLEECKVIQIYKEEYQSQTTKECHGHIFKAKILLDIFNYWTNDGALSFSAEEANKHVKVSAANQGHLSLMLSGQALGKWIANNWCLYVTVKASKSEVQFTRIDAVWRTQRAVVEAKLKIMLGVDKLDTLTQGYFEQCTAAARHVHECMDEGEKKKIENEVKKVKVEGNEPEIREK